MKLRACILLISALSLCAEAQRLMGTLLVDVAAKDDVQVFWSIFGANNPGVVITYTVYYDINLDDPMNFTSNSQGAMSLPPTSADRETLTGIPQASFVTVVVRATGDNGGALESRPITQQTFADESDIPAPMDVTVQRFDINTVLIVSWSPIDSPQILSYDVEYRIYKSDISSTVINTNTPLNSAEIAGVDGNTNYEVRVRAVIEIAKEDNTDPDVIVNTVTGSWSDWVLSQGNTDQGALSGGASSFSTIIFTVFLLPVAVILFGFY